MSCDEISADWAQRIKGSTCGARCRTRCATRSQDGQKKAGDKQIKTLIESFQYPRKGPGMMWDAAADEGACGRWRDPHGTRLTNMLYNEREKLWAITATTVDGTPKYFTARHVISSAPIRELVHSIGPVPA